MVNKRYINHVSANFCIFVHIYVSEYIEYICYMTVCMPFLC